MTNDFFRSPQIPRRPKPPTTPTPHRPILFQIESPSQAPEILSLDPLLAQVLAQLAAAGEAGLLNTDPKMGGRVGKLRRQGLPIETTREPRKDGGSGWLARYRLGCDVQRLQEVN